MKKFFKLIMLVMILAVVTMSCTKVESGYVGVKVHLLGGDKGVDNEVVGVGRYWIGPNVDLYTFPTFQVNYTFTKDPTEGSPDTEEFIFQTSEGMECSVDLGVSMHFDKDKIATMFQTYRKGVDEIRGTVVRNILRDNLNKLTSTVPVESVYGEGKARLLDTLQLVCKNQLAASGIIIDKIYLIGSIRIPTTVKNALDAKVQATQEAMKIENKLRAAEAEAKIKVVNAEAEARANEVLMRSITPTYIQYIATQKWDGKLPNVTSGAIPFINVK